MTHLSPGFGHDVLFLNQLLTSVNVRRDGHKVFSKAGSHVADEAKVVYYDEPPLVDFYMTIFIRGVPLENDTASECIRTIDATYGTVVKNLQLYECHAKEYRY